MPKRNTIMVLFEAFPFLEEWISELGGWPSAGWLLGFCVSYAAIGTWWAFSMIRRDY